MPQILLPALPSTAEPPTCCTLPRWQWFLSTALCYASSPLHTHDGPHVMTARTKGLGLSRLLCPQVAPTADACFECCARHALPVCFWSRSPLAPFCSAFWHWQARSKLLQTTSRPSNNLPRPARDASSPLTILCISRRVPTPGSATCEMPATLLVQWAICSRCRFQAAHPGDVQARHLSAPSCRPS